MIIQEKEITDLELEIEKLKKEQEKKENRWLQQWEERENIYRENLIARDKEIELGQMKLAQEKLQFQTYLQQKEEELKGKERELNERIREWKEKIRKEKISEEELDKQKTNFENILAGKEKEIADLKSEYAHREEDLVAQHTLREAEILKTKNDFEEEFKELKKENSNGIFRHQRELELKEKIRSLLETGLKKVEARLGEENQNREKISSEIEEEKIPVKKIVAESKEEVSSEKKDINVEKLLEKRKRFWRK